MYNNYRNKEIDEIVKKEEIPEVEFTEEWED
jgi:hypothetical protein